MKLLNIIYSVVLTFFLVLPFSSFGQHSAVNTLQRDTLIDVARQIMATVGTCALITVDQEGRSRVRAMDPFSPDEDMTVWFATNPNSRKVDQIRNDPRVTLYYLANDATGYVMIHGTALLVHDLEEKKQRWKEQWANFYPNRTDDYLLIKVSPEWMEVISESHGILGDSVTWEPPIVKFN